MAISISGPFASSPLSAIAATPLGMVKLFIAQSQAASASDPSSDLQIVSRGSGPNEAIRCEAELSAAGSGYRQLDTTVL